MTWSNISQFLSEPPFVRWSTGDFLIEYWIKNCIAEKYSQKFKRKTELVKAELRSGHVCSAMMKEETVQGRSTIELDSSSPSLVSDNCNINQYRWEGCWITLCNVYQLKSLLEWSPWRGEMVPFPQSQPPTAATWRWSKASSWLYSGQCQCPVVQTMGVLSCKLNIFPRNFHLAPNSYNSQMLIFLSCVLLSGKQKIEKPPKTYISPFILNFLSDSANCQESTVKLYHSL